jgi:hypothetical protein
MVLLFLSHQFVFKIRLYGTEALEIVRMGRGGDSYCIHGKLWYLRC